MCFVCRLSGENRYLEDLPERRQDTELVIPPDHIRCQWTPKDRRADFVPTNSTHVEPLISRNGRDTLLPKLPNGLKKGDIHFYVYGDNIKTDSKPTLAVIRAPPPVQRFIMSCLHTATEKQKVPSLLLNSCSPKRTDSLPGQIFSSAGWRDANS